MQTPIIKCLQWLFIYLTDYITKTTINQNKTGNCYVGMIIDPLNIYPVTEE